MQSENLFKSIKEYVRIKSNSYNNSILSTQQINRKILYALLK